MIKLFLEWIFSRLLQHIHIIKVIISNIIVKNRMNWQYILDIYPIICNFETFDYCPLLMLSTFCPENFQLLNQRDSTLQTSTNKYNQ